MSNPDLKSLPRPDDVGFLERWPPHLAIIHIYSRNQTSWADFAELAGPYTAMAAKCREIDVIVPNGTTAQADLPQNLHVHRISGSSNNPLLFIGQAIFKLNTINRTRPIDIIWVQDPLACGVVGWLSAMWLRIPWVAEFCNDFYHLEHMETNFAERLLCRYLATFMAKRSDRVRAVGPTIVDALVRAGVPRGKISMISSPTEMSRFDASQYACVRKSNREAWSITDCHTVLMFVGALVARKGVANLIDAFDKLTRDFPKVRLIVVGDGPMRAELESRARSLHLGERVRFLGRISHGKVPSVLAAADIVVLPSFNEGMPRCLVEAMAMEKPVIATRISGNSDLIRHDDTGILVEPDRASLEAGLRRMLHLTASAREAMGRRGREYVQSRFDMVDTVERMCREFIVKPLLQYRSKGNPECVAG
jgi:glycosyltransferase involved in cell wall biosynthesis